MSLEDPRFKIRYAEGLGDFIACILHSKILSRLTEWITGKKVPCRACSQRAQALNILFPIPFWRLFFKTVQEARTHKVVSIKQFNERCTNCNPTTHTDFAEEQEEQEEYDDYPVTSKESNFSIPALDEKTNSLYSLISSNESEFGNYLIRTQIFSKK